jgi:hypothetical protein
MFYSAASHARHATHRRLLLLRRSTYDVPWADKEARAFFRGRRNEHERVFALVGNGTAAAHAASRSTLVALSATHAADVDARFVEGADAAAEVPIREHARRKYLLALDGITGSFRLARLLWCNSLVLKETSPWQEYFYRGLTPGVHYEHVFNTAPDDVLAVLARARRDDAAAQRVALAGQAFAARYLCPRARVAYCRRRLWRTWGCLKGTRWAHTRGSARGRLSWRARAARRRWRRWDWAAAAGEALDAVRRMLTHREQRQLSARVGRSCVHNNAARAPLPLSSPVASALLRGVHAVSRVMATDEAQGQARATFASLPRALQHAILRRVPADARARCACLNSGWRNELTDVSLWTRLDLSPSSGMTCIVNDAALRAASGLARGRLEALDVSGRDVLAHDTLIATLAANAGALTELQMLKTGGQLAYLACPNAEALLRAAPQLRVLEADVWVTAAEAARMLRNEEPFGPLRLRHLDADFEEEEDVGVIAEVTAAIAAHASLSSVSLTAARLDVPGALDAVVDAALARRLSAVSLSFCRLSPASAPALARLLGGSALTELYIANAGVQLLDAPAAALLGDALRANTTLAQLTAHNINLYVDAAAAVTLLGALAGHVSLRALALAQEYEPSEQAAALIGRALGALIAANMSRLKELYIMSCRLGDAGMRPLLEALPRFAAPVQFKICPQNTHLEILMCAGNGMSAAFTRDVLLPAARANTSLLLFHAGDEHEAEVEASAFVAAQIAARAVH